MSEEIRRFVMDVNERIIRQVAARCTAQEMQGIMGVNEDRRKSIFAHYLELIKGD